MNTPCTITAPATAPSALCIWLAELAKEAGSSLFILWDSEGKLDIRLERGTHGRYDAVVECEMPFSDELEAAAFKALQTLEAAGTHTVRRTDRGIRAYLRAGWTARYEGRQSGNDPAEFDASACRPRYTQTLPDEPKPCKVKPSLPFAGGWGRWRPAQPANTGACVPPATTQRNTLPSSPDAWSDDELNAVGC